MKSQLGKCCEDMNEVDLMLLLWLKTQKIMSHSGVFCHKRHWQSNTIAPRRRAQKLDLA